MMWAVSSVAYLRGVLERVRIRRLLVDVVPSAVLAVAAAHELLYNRAPLWQWVVAQALVWLLVVRRGLPTPVLSGTLVLALLAWSHDLLLVADLAVLVALHSVALLRPRACAVAAGLVVELGTVLVAVRFAPTGSVGDAVVLLTGLVLTALLLGTTQRTQQVLVGALVDRADQLEREREHKAVIAAAEERTRIAREIHDIVAHSVSVMIALSEGAAATPDPERARGSMRQVAATGREALAELRRVLSVLHQPGADGRAPSPAIADLHALVRDVELAGLAVDLQVSGPVDELTEALQVTVFRIVQECLTNTLKHALDARRCTVSIRVDEHEVRLEVHDDGSVAEGPPATVGSGIRGMSERVELYAGVLGAGPGTGPEPAGWVVTGRLQREVSPARDRSPAG